MTLYRTLATAIGISLLLVTGASAQDAKAPVVKKGFAIHNTVDLGGHIAEQSGSTAMYDTLVNIQSGPRVLGETLTMHAVAGQKHFPLFDSLYAFSNGFGGDPLNVASLRASKGKLYDFVGNFRRDRQYFDYDLLGNPLTPTGLVSNGYTFPQQLNSPHLYNTVRRMTDVSLTLFPVAKYTIRLNYSKNVIEGPSYSSMHIGGDILLLQNFRNSSDRYTAGLDWKPFSRTVVTLQEDISAYKEDTNYSLANYNLLQLSNGQPVSYGYDNYTVPSCTNHLAVIQSNTTTPATGNPTCSGTEIYTRSQPTRTFTPTETFRFVTANVPKLHMNGNFSYTGASMNLPNYNEFFTGLTRSPNGGPEVQVYNTTASAYGQRIDVSANFGAVYELTERIVLTEQFDFNSFRQPASLNYFEQDQSAVTTAGVYSMLNAPSTTLPAAYTYINTSNLSQTSKSNLASVAYEISPKASVSVGYRYRTRTLNRVLLGNAGTSGMPEQTPAGSNYALTINENGGILGVDLRPTSKLTVNGSAEAYYDDNAYVQTSPRATQHYKVRGQYKPNAYTNIYAAYNDLERRNNVTLVNHFDHNRSVSVGANVAPNEHYSVAFDYAYVDSFSNGVLCYDAGVTPVPNPIPTGTGCGTNTSLGNAYYHAPTQSGSIGIVLTPNKTVRTGFGYRANSTAGTTQALSPNQVPGSLQSQYMTPYANVALTLAPAWIWKADWNYYGYNEQGAPVGRTAPRDFHGNVVTLGMHYEF